MRGKVQRWGNSLAIRIPKVLAMQIGLEEQGEVDISVVDTQIVVSPAAPSPYTLDRLLAGVTQDNRHAEVSTGSSMGNEVW
jgi:antitoxin MazE